MLGTVWKAGWWGSVLAGLMMLLAGCGSTGPHATCPGSGAPRTHFCLTASEAGLKDRVVHVPTVSDALLLKAGVSLTIGPNDHSKITEKEAEAAVALVAHAVAPGGAVRSAVFAEIHSPQGLPAKAAAVWLVDITPKGAPGYVIVVVNASTGAVMYTDAYRP